MKAHRLITLICTMLLCAAIAVAQTSGDKLYNQGLQLQKTMTIDAQNKAIAKFQAAKKLYDSTAKKSQCDQAIQVSQGIIKQIKSGGGGSRGGKTTTQVIEVVAEPTLDISPTAFDLPQEGSRVQVVVATNQDEWSVAPVSDGSERFAMTTVSDDNISIYVPANNTYERRTQKFHVLAGDLIREFTVTQLGKPVMLTANEASLSFKLSGNKKQVEISCNSTHSYPDNSNENWYIVSKPDWVIVTINPKKGGGLLGTVKKATQKIANEITGSGQPREDASVKKTSVTFQAKPILKGSSEAATGRQGEIVIQSGETTFTIYVTQSK